MYDLRQFLAVLVHWSCNLSQTWTIIFQFLCVQYILVFEVILNPHDNVPYKVLFVLQMISVNRAGSITVVTVITGSRRARLPGAKLSLTANQNKPIW